MNKEKSWPIGIIAGYSLFALSMIGFAVWSAIHHPVDLVSKDYYAREIAYQEVIDATQRAAQSQDTLEITFDQVTGSMTIRWLGEKDSAPTEGVLSFYRPSDSHLDFQQPIQFNQQGLQVVTTTTLQKGPWRVHATWSQEGQPFLVSKNLVVGEHS